MTQARPVWGYQLIAALLFFLLIAPSLLAEEGRPRSFVILAINDVYRIAGVDGGQYGGLARVRSLRAELEREHPDLLLLHAGDLLFPSLLSRHYAGEQMIDVLNLLDRDASTFDARMFVTFGNHEFDKAKLKDAAALDRRVEESQFHWLGSNLEFLSGEDGHLLVEADNLVDSVLTESNGTSVGLFSLTIDVKDPAYIARFGKPEDVARQMTAQLRQQGAEVVIALTHLRLAQDAALLRVLGPDGPDLIIGGHEHNKQARKVTGRWVIKADAEARTATVITVTPRPDSPPQVSYEFRTLGQDYPPDPIVQARVADWFQRYDHEICEPPDSDCLNVQVGKTQVDLIGEELEIRRFETNLGNWVVDQARVAFAKSHGAQIAFINSGSLRLNQNIPAGPITQQDILELFAYPASLKLLRLTGATLQQVVDHAVQDWTGNGWWLQISGFAYEHDPDTGRACCLTLVTEEGTRRIAPEEKLVVVTNEFLTDPQTGQDGYTVLSGDAVEQLAGPDIDLKTLVVEALQKNQEEGITPEVEGRICNPQRAASPCLALTP